MGLRFSFACLLLVAVGCGGAERVFSDEKQDGSSGQPDASRDVRTEAANDAADAARDTSSDAPSCMDNTACRVPRPYCDNGKCVACTTDDHCGVALVCKNGGCVPGCNAQKGCGDAGACDLVSGTCKTCMNDTECTDPANPRC